MSGIGLFPYLNIRHVHFRCNNNTSGGLCVLNRCCDSGAADCTNLCTVWAFVQKGNRCWCLPDLLRYCKLYFRFF